MPIQFEIQRIAIHLVDKKDKTGTGPRYSSSVVDLDSTSYTEEQSGAIRAFLAAHVKRAWDAPEGGRTRAAQFEEMSQIRRSYEAPPDDKVGFFDLSKAIADRLFKLSPGNASRGLLLVLRFTVPDAPQPFLGLFKLDPGDRDQIALERDESGQTLLQLAVEHIDEALPDPGERVLKWALIPHPPVAGEQSRFELKLRDEQQAGDPAVYFERFLGCVVRPSAKQEIQEVFHVLADYGKEHHANQDWRPKLDKLVRNLSEGKEIVTPDVVARKVEKAAVFTGFDESAFREKLAGSGAREMQVSPERFRRARIRYELPSGIVIQGPADAMEDHVKPVKKDGGYVIEVSTADYEKTVEP